MRSCRMLVVKFAPPTIAWILWLLMGGQYAPAQSFTSIYSFCAQSNCPDGNAPNGWLVQGQNGNFYGTTYAGGTNSSGTVFMISPAGALTTLHAFNGTDGNEPSALILATDQNVYGTTVMGGGESCPRGNGLCGTIFKISQGGAFTTLYTFCSKPNCADGFFPAAALVQGKDGNLYGTTQHGGVSGQCGGMGCGTIFKITPSGTLTTLYSFCPGGNCQFLAPDGSNPSAALVQGADGSFYGTTQTGGSDNGCSMGCGTVFQLTSAGVLTTLHQFVNSVDGSLPGQLLQALDGNLYGVNAGYLYRVNPSGMFATIHMFTITDGFLPVGLMQATDGNLYGTTQQGGNNNCTFGCGTIFKTNYSGAITTLHQFSGSDGAAPQGGLVQGTDGNFYGTTSQGGSSTNCQQNGCGTVFKLGVGLSPFIETVPSFGGFGEGVVVLGTNLTGATSVKFNGTPATFNVLAPSVIAATVPTGATTGTVQVTAPSGTFNSNTDFQIQTALRFSTINPCRLIDTRQSGGPIPGGTQRTFTVPQLGNCGIPTSAGAYSLNVTVLPQGHLGFLTIWPAGEIQPYVSTMNSSDGRTKANAAIVPAGNNAVSVYVTDAANVILDVDGFFQPSVSQTVRFFPLAPCRVVDTRQMNFPQGLGAPSFGNMEARELPVFTNSPCFRGLPSQPLAYSFNVTASPKPAGQTLDFLRIWPSDQQEPTVSTLNNPTATVVANAAIVQAAHNGDVSVFTYNSTDVIIDVNGYFGTPGGLSFYAAAPCRAYDSRNDNGQPFSGERTVNIAGGACEPPGSAEAYVFNATVVPSPRLGYLTLWADTQQQPTVSTLNAYDGFVTSNMAVVPNSNGKTDALAGDGTTQLILDISGYFAP